MPIQYRAIKYNLEALHKMGEDNWILCSACDGMMIFYKQSKKASSAKPTILSSTFDGFYKKYPNKKAKQNALVMWNRLNEKEQELAISGLERYLIYWRKKGIEKEHIPHPATWLNQKRWEDDLSEDVKISPTTQTQNLQKELEEDKKIDEEKERINRQMIKIKTDPELYEEWKEKVDSKLTKEQIEGEHYKMLFDIRFRMMLNEK